MVMTDNCTVTISTINNNENVVDGSCEQNGCDNTGSPSPPPVAAAAAAESTPIVVDEDEPEVGRHFTMFMLQFRTENSRSSYANYTASM